MKTHLHPNPSGPFPIQRVFLLNWYLILLIWTQSISCFVKFNRMDLGPGLDDGPLQSEKLTKHDLSDLVIPLQNYLTKYDHQLVCGDLDPKDEACTLTMDMLTKQYFQNALNQRLGSRIWRQSEDGKPYGAILILDPNTSDPQEVSQLLKLSTRQRENCAKTILGLEENERLRYIRLHLGPGPNVPAGLAKQMLQQFVDESTQAYLCSEYSAAGEHEIGIFVNQMAVKHFTKFNFQPNQCGQELVDACENNWFKDRCLVTKTVTSKTCDLLA